MNSNSLYAVSAFNKVHDSSNVDHAIKQINLSGNHYVMGQQHGFQVRELRPHILDAIDTRLDTLAKVKVDVQPFITEISAMWDDLARPTMDMLRGIADSLSLDWEILHRYTLASYVLALLQNPNNDTQGCSTWAASGHTTRQGVPILAKNRDYWPNHQRLQCLVQARPIDKYAYLYMTSAGSPGIFSSGMNELGLVVADTHVASRDIGPGLPRFAIMMELLESYNSVQSALSYLKGMRHIGNGTITLLDASGEMAVFETGYSYSGIVRSDEGYVVSTNHFVTTHLEGFHIERGPKAIRGNSRARYAKIRQNLGVAQGEVDLAWAQNIMTSHGSPMEALCRHHPVNPPYATTISSAIYLPRECEVYLTNGIPCQTEFRRFKLTRLN